MRRPHVAAKIAEFKGSPPAPEPGMRAQSKVPSGVRHQAKLKPEYGETSGH